MTCHSRRWNTGRAAIVLLGALIFALPDAAAGPARDVDVARLPAAEAIRLGWRPARLDAVFDYATSLSTDTLIIATAGETVGTLGDPARRYNVHSVRKALLSALVGQHVGPGDRQLRLDATLAELGIDDAPVALTPLQRQATVLHLVKSLSGINHAAAAEGGVMPDKDRRLGRGENVPGTKWAYNNWDYNALTSIFETRTGLSVAAAFEIGIAGPTGMRDFTLAAVSYSAAPDRSRHRAAMFRMSGRDLARFGELYLDAGAVRGRQVVPAAWVARVATDFTDTGDGGLRAGHGYLWWIPARETGLPPGSYWASGFGRQAVFVIPEWRTVIVHQSDTTVFIKRWTGLIARDRIAPMAALERIALWCHEPGNASSEYCREHRFILRREFNRLIELIVQARG